jgi:ABC-type transporter Mla subunit MlaD
VRRLAWIALAVAIVPWLVIGVVEATGDQDRDDAYFVRAIFDNAASLVQGEDVKIAGAPVGVVDSLEVTADNKAAVILRIDDEDFTPWKSDASCVIRPQSLIGEKFLECEPGSASEPRLREIKDGDGEGERLLPLANTSSPVDIDMLNDVLRLPYRQRFAILLSELGAGLAGRGEDLNAVIHRANPALKETDEVLAILAKQNRVLARLARDSDRALAPLARERERVAGFIVEANATGQASAERRGDIKRGLERLPEFLRQLRPLMADLDSFAKQGTPLLRDLGTAAPDVARLIKGLGTFSTAANESFPSLGDALERGRPALLRARPLIQQLKQLGIQLGPTANNLDKLAASLDDTGGLERLNDFFYYGSLSINGFDSLGHYLRAGLITTTCSSYAIEPVGAAACHAFYNTPSQAAAASSRSARAESRAAAPKSSPKQGSALLQELLGSPETKAGAQQRTSALEGIRRRGDGQSPALDSTSDPALDYLLGGDR